jgi:hypothetical protein
MTGKQEGVKDSVKQWVRDEVMGDDWLMLEHAQACFVLPLWEAIAHFAIQDLRPTETGGWL